MPKPGTLSARAKVVLVDDCPMVRERLAQAINHERDLIVCGEAEDCRSALEVIARVLPELAIIDLALGNSHGLELIKDLRVRWPKLLILVLSARDECCYAERAVRAGARGFIAKREPTRNILAAVRAVLGGQLYLSPAMNAHIASKAVARRQGAPGPSVQSLADRELEVFEWIGRGFSTQEIAERLRLHLKTVETYRCRIKDKLRLKDAHELLRHAIEWRRLDL